MEKEIKTTSTRDNISSYFYKFSWINEFQFLLVILKNTYCLKQKRTLPERGMSVRQPYNFCERKFRARLPNLAECKGQLYLE